MVDPQLEEINIVIIGKHPFESLFHNATILSGISSSLMEYESKRMYMLFGLLNLDTLLWNIASPC